MEAPTALVRRFDGIDNRLKALEVLLRFDGLLARIAALEGGKAALQEASSQAESKTRSDAPSSQASQVMTQPPEASDVSPTQQRLQQELDLHGFSAVRFSRVPSNYYDNPLEFRMSCVGAASTAHLCKCIIMENTRAHPSVENWANPLNSQYYTVIVQYTARLHTEKIKSYVHKLSEGKIGKQFFNFRLAPEDVSDRLSGYLHNAVTPIGMATRLPMIMSHKILSLNPDFFFLGAGEVDLKVGLKASEFVQAYKPFVVDCTYE